MELEIERKYLLRALPDMPPASDVLEVEQGYLPGEKLVERLRRQRHRDGTIRYYRTVKLGAGLSRVEIEDETDQRTFEHLWVLTEGRRIRKRRYLVPDGPCVWEIDEFTDRELALAELELDAADERVELPAWLRPVVVREVTDEKAYTNRSLAR